MQIEHQLIHQQQHSKAIMTLCSIVTLAYEDGIITVPRDLLKGTDILHQALETSSTLAMPNVSGDLCWALVMCLLGLNPPTEEMQLVAAEYGIFLPFYGPSKKRSAEEDWHKDTDASVIAPSKRRRSDGYASTTESSATEGDSSLIAEQDEKDCPLLIDRLPSHTNASPKRSTTDRIEPLTKARKPIKKRTFVGAKISKRKMKFQHIRVLLRDDVVVDKCIPTFF